MTIFIQTNHLLKLPPNPIIQFIQTNNRAHHIMNESAQTYPQYYKEYTCTFFSPTTSTTSWNKQIKFKEYPTSIQHTSTCIDPYKSISNLYCLLWNSTLTTHSLFIRHIKCNSWIKIDMNYPPSNALVTDDHLFLFGKRELFVISLIADGQVKCIQLQDSKMVDCKICYTEKGESGVFAVQFNKKCGYFSRQYSKSSDSGYWAKVKSYLNFSMTTFQQFKHFKIIIPNILGLAFTNQNKFQIYDLNKMQPTSMIPVTLNLYNNINPIIKWRLIQPNAGFDDAILLYIGNERIINIYRVELVRLKFKIEGENEQQIDIDRLIKGNIVDWSKSIISYQTEIMCKEHIINFEVNGSDIVAATQNCNQILQLSIISQIDKQTKAKILTQQNSHWRQYLSSKADSDILNRLYLPNNYPREMLELTTHGQNKVSSNYQRLNQQMQKKWLQFAKFTDILVINNRVYLTRHNFINSIQSISKYQFQVQSLEDKQKNAILCKQNVYVNQQNCYFSKKLMSQMPASIHKEYKNIISTLKKQIQFALRCDISQFSYVQNSILPELTDQFCSNIAKDRILFYSNFIQFYTETLQNPQKSIKNKLLYLNLAYFKQSLTHSYEQHKIYSQTFLDMLMTKLSQNFTPHFQLNLTYIFKQLFKNVIESCGLSQNKVNYSYRYIQIMIKELLQNTDDEQKIWLIQSQLKRYVKHLFKINQNTINPIFFYNSTLLQAYLISNPPTKELQIFLKQLIAKEETKPLLKQLNKIRHLIPSQLEVLFKIQLICKQQKSISNQSMISQQVQTSIIKPSLLKQLLEEDILYNSKGQLFRQAKEQLIKQLKKLQTSKSNQFECVLTQINQLYGSQHAKDVDTQNYQQILQVQQLMLTHFANLFNHQFYNISNISAQLLPQFKKYLLTILNQIQNSFVSYRKYFIKLYDDQKGNNLIYCSYLDRIAYDEGLMIAGFMSTSITLVDELCSHAVISIIKRTITNDKIITSLLDRKVIIKKQDLISAIIQQALKKRVYANEDIDTINYYLYKKGQQYIVNTMRQLNCAAADKLQRYYAYKNSDQHLYVVACQELKNQQLHSLKKYVNPYK